MAASLEFDHSRKISAASMERTIKLRAVILKPMPGYRCQQRRCRPGGSSRHKEPHHHLKSIALANRRCKSWFGPAHEGQRGLGGPDLFSEPFGVPKSSLSG